MMNGKEVKVLLIGTGAVGSVIATKLIQQKNISYIICADKKMIRNVPKTTKVQYLQLDASQIKEVAAAAKKTNIIINASLPNYNIPIMKAALTAGVHYQDLCSHLLNLKTPEQLQFHMK
ncbi:TPA: hypothetical protein HA241_03455 [Candidatus Woesearchaeota archaeon]|nr:hypothetical protein [Candidatus Woesearchaeota archaeon]